MITAAVKITSAVTTAATMITTGGVVALSLWRVLMGCILLLLTVMVALGIDVPCEAKHKK